MYLRLKKRHEYMYIYIHKEMVADIFLSSHIFTAIFGENGPI